MPMRPKSHDKRLQSERRKEVRKEKSKEAARNRRGKEGEVFTDLTDTLPVPDSVKGSLDKSSIIRLCINYIKTREALQSTWPEEQTDKDSRIELDDAFDILHGLVLVLSPSGDVHYITENVKSLLGICRYDVIGNGLESFIHPADWNDTVEKELKSGGSSLGFTSRFKCTLSARGKMVNLKSAIYKTLRFSGRRLNSSDDVKSVMNPSRECLILMATPVDSLSQSEQPLDSNTFTSRHSLDMKFTECDTLITDLTRYPEAFIKGKSLYEFIHPSDLQSFETSVKSLYSKEQMLTNPYKLLTFGGGYLTMVTQASVYNDSKTGKPEHILCVNHAISQIEESDVIMDEVQLIHKSDCVKVEAAVSMSQCCKGGEREFSQTTPEVPASEVTDYDDIFDTTASCFMEASDVEYKDVFETHALTGSELVSGTASSPGGTINMEKVSADDGDSGALDLEALIAKMDNDEVDLPNGLLMDMPDLSDETDENYYLRAPYISMDDFTDLSWVESSYAGESPSPVGSTTSIDRTAYRQAKGSAFSSGSPSDSYSSQSFDSELSPDCADFLDALDIKLERSPPISPLNSDPVFGPQSDIANCLNDRLSINNIQQSPPSNDVLMKSNDRMYDDSPRPSYQSHRLPLGNAFQSRTTSSSDQRHYTQSHRKRKLNTTYDGMGTATVQSLLQPENDQRSEEMIQSKGSIKTEVDQAYTIHSNLWRKPTRRVLPLTDGYRPRADPCDPNQSLIEDLLAVLNPSTKRSKEICDGAVSSTIGTEDVNSDYLSSLGANKLYSELEWPLVDSCLTQKQNGHGSPGYDPSAFPPAVKISKGGGGNARDRNETDLSGSSEFLMELLRQTKT